MSVFLWQSGSNTVKFVNIILGPKKSEALEQKVYVFTVKQRYSDEKGNHFPFFIPKNQALKHNIKILIDELRSRFRLRDKIVIID